MPRIALGIEYDGTPFSGWQILSHRPSVQAALERALSFVADEPIDAVCAGRTDAGVHARCQVVHFDTRARRSERGWMLGTTTRLPSEVCVRWAREVPDDFHARYTALTRRYAYTLRNRTVRPALDARHVAWEALPLDAARMHEAAQALVGEHDFTAFRALACQSRTPMRRLDRIRVTREGDLVRVEVEANAFLHHMVRNIVGSLLEVGRGERPTGWIAELLAGRARDRAGVTAPPQGLVFVGPTYPARFDLPAEVIAS